MPRYFFHMCHDGNRYADHTGQTLKDPDQAWEAARAVASDLMKTDVGKGPAWSSYRFEVTDEAGQVVLEFPFSEALEVKSRPS